MASKTIVAPSNVWDFFHSNKDRFGTEMYLIAESNDGMTGIYIAEKDGNPQFFVENCDEVIDECVVITKTDCEEAAELLYLEYLDCDELDILDVGFEQDIIQEREDEITVLFQNLLFDLLVDTANEDIINNIVEDVKEHTLEYIARKHNLPIYRPMYLEDEDGNDFYSEYPYEEMIFDDFNPIYEPTD